MPQMQQDVAGDDHTAGIVTYYNNDQTALIIITHQMFYYLIYVYSTSDTLPTLTALNRVCY
jgi:energy-coupling factor transporter ATP-binding protein EcfA2